MRLPAFAYAIEPLNAQHNRIAFRCGMVELDRYLQEQAGQDMRRRVAAPFVLHDLEAGRIAGYYTLAATSLQLDELPQEMPKEAS